MYTFSSEFIFTICIYYTSGTIHPHEAPAWCWEMASVRISSLWPTQRCRPWVESPPTAPSPMHRALFGMQCLQMAPSDFCKLLVSIVCGCKNQWFLFCTGNWERERGARMWTENNKNSHVKKYQQAALKKIFLRGYLSVCFLTGIYLISWSVN